MDLIKFVSERLGKECIEVDVKNCFPRVIYALNGLELPKNFYGVDRSNNKKKINIALNSFGMDKKLKSSERLQLSRSKKRLEGLGIDLKVVEWLINNFFNNKFKSDFFNFLAYHERNIIGAACDIMRQQKNDLKLYRRHDSFIMFSNNSYKCLDDFSYLGVKGWFNSYVPNEKDEFNIEDYATS